MITVKLKDLETPDFLHSPKYLFRWRDATSYHRKKMSEIRSSTPTSLLSEAQTIGVKLYEDKNVLVICTEVCDDEVDITAIPKSWLIEVRSLRWSDSNGKKKAKKK